LTYRLPPPTPVRVRLRCVLSPPPSTKKPARTFSGAGRFHHWLPGVLGDQL